MKAHAEPLPAWMEEWLELVEEGHRHLVRFRRIGEEFIAVVPFIFTAAIIKGMMGANGNYEDRWCYEDMQSANLAFDAWDGEGEPCGWHRHPATGRRRVNGDPHSEYVAV